MQVVALKTPTKSDPALMGYAMSADGIEFMFAYRDKFRFAARHEGGGYYRPERPSAALTAAVNHAVRRKAAGKKFRTMRAYERTKA